MEREELKAMLKSCIKFIKANHTYIIWSIINFFISFLILGADASSFLACIFLSFISFNIALSPVGEWILRQINGVRSLETRREKEYLIPLFEDIYEDVKGEYPYLQDIEICIIDSLTVNAFALGTHTVAVTRGAIETFTEDELKGILLHEIGHIIHGDTKAILLNLIGNGFFSICIVVIKLFLLCFEIFFVSVDKKPKGLAYLVSCFLRLIFTMLLFAFTLTGNILISINSRKNEFSADSFANEIGYGEDLTNALYLLQKMSLGEDMRLVERIQASHPHIAKRIGRLEALETDG